MGTELLERCRIAADIVGQLFLDEPQGPLLDALSAPSFLQSWPLEDNTSQQAITGLLQAERDTAEALQRDHLYLFIGVSSPLAQPYESPYFSKDGLVMDDDTAAVAAFYHQVGFAPGADNLPPDHIGLEFRCISHLCTLALNASGEEARTAALGALKTFTTEHPARFAEQVLGCVEKHANTAIYRALPGLARGVLAAVETL